MKKQNNSYYFSVEGETEKYYLEHLRHLINRDEERTCNVSFKIKITDSPKSFVKGTNTITPLNFIHLTDVESLGDYHIQCFKDELTELKEVKKDMSSRVEDYLLGYTNFTFEIWMILHKKDCNRSFNNRTEYLRDVNISFDKNYESLNEFKRESEFKSVLSLLTLDDVREAIKRAESIMNNLEQDGASVKQYKGYNYYSENPSLSLHEIIKSILLENGL